MAEAPPEATPAARDLVWGGAAGLAGGVGVTLLYRVLALSGAWNEV